MAFDQDLINYGYSDMRIIWMSVVWWVFCYNFNLCHFRNLEKLIFFMSVMTIILNRSVSMIFHRFSLSLSVNFLNCYIFFEWHTMLLKLLFMKFRSKSEVGSFFGIKLKFSERWQILSRSIFTEQESVEIYPNWRFIFEFRMTNNIYCQSHPNTYIYKNPWLHRHRIKVSL